MGSLSLSDRLDRLPLTTTHRFAVAALCFAFFFELADLNTFAYAAPAIVAQWHIGLNMVAFVTACSFGGMFLGGTLGGVAAQRIGRKPAFIWSICLYCVFSVLTAFAWNAASMAALRFLTGIGLSAMTIIANVYISEFFPAKKRGTYMSGIFTLGLLGIPATAWVARLVMQTDPGAWRWVFVWGSLGLLALPLALKMVESPRWLINQGRVDEAVAIVLRLERAANIDVTTLDTRAERLAEPRTSYRALFSATYRKRTFGLSAIWIFQTLGFYGFVSWVPTLLVQHGFTITKSLEFSSLIAICNPIGAWLGTQIIERFERKWLIAANAVVIAIAGMAYGTAGSSMLIVVFGALVTIAIQLMNATLYIYTPESYPTTLRSAGAGLCYGLGRLTNVIGPFVVSALYTGLGYTSVFAYIAGCWLVVALVVACVGPRTTGLSLEEIDDSSNHHELRSSHYVGR